MKNRRKERNSFFYYAVGLLALAGLIMAAFFAPQIVFQMQDSILCRDIDLGVRESAGVEALNTTYEKSLGKRMRNFAEGLAGGENYYVAMQELEGEEDLYEYLYSESALYSTILGALVEGGLLPYDFWVSTAVVRQWKQYVIYSDNYAKGVNFILRYIEVESTGGAVLKLLSDAEDGTVYAVKLEESENIWMTDGMDSRYLRGYVSNPFIASELWYFFAASYGAMGIEEVETVIKALESNIKYETDVDEEGAVAQYTPRFAAETTVGDLTIGYYPEDENRMRFRLPYGEATLDVVMEVEGAGAEEYGIGISVDPEILDLEEMQINNQMTCPNIVIGVQEIYEMVPEFA